MKKLGNKFLILMGVIALALIIFIYYNNYLNFFSLENLKAHREYLQNFVNNNYLLSVALYLLFCIVIVATTLPLSAFMMILAGFLFGMTLGMIYANIGITIGALISFTWLKFIFGHTVPAGIKEKLDIFSKKIEQYGAFYFLSLHLMSFLPFFLINALAVITNISTFTFVWTSAVGVIPISLLYTYMGQRLGTINSVKEVLTVPVLGALVLLVILAISPILISKIRKK